MASTVADDILLVADLSFRSPDFGVYAVHYGGRRRSFVEGAPRTRQARLEKAAPVEPGGFEPEPSRAYPSDEEFRRSSL